MSFSTWLTVSPAGASTGVCWPTARRTPHMAPQDNSTRVDRLAQEFVARFRRGERPSVQEYVDQYPDLADEIRGQFPTLVDRELPGKGHATPATESEQFLAPCARQVGGYRIIRQLGRGGMGIVYEAEQLSLGRRVALKLLPVGLSRDARALERFRREAKAAAKLHHTNIVPVFEVGEDGEAAFYAMQLIDGQPLDRVINELQRMRGDPLPDPRRAPTVPDEPDSAGTPSPDSSHQKPTVESRQPAAAPAMLPGPVQLSAAHSDPRHFFRSAAQLGHQAATALAHAHARGIVHRDIKPSNLLLDGAGVVWVTDFGLAYQPQERAQGGPPLTHAGDILGTLRYMAPERFQGECDARADVYALGLTLYELLTLRPAFDETDRLRLIEQIKDHEPLRPRSLDPRIPRYLGTMVLN